MSPAIKVWYFDMKGRAECIRLLLALTGQDFEDIRFKKEEWPKYKPDAPYGQAPFIEINGVKHGQMLAIIQYLAREYGLYGESNMDAFTIDQVLHLIQELVPLGGRIFHENDPEKKENVLKEMKEVASPRVLGYIEGILKRNGTGFIVGNQLTVGDVAVFDLCDSAIKTFIAPLDGYPLISALCQNVSKNERIKAYIDSRPHTDM